MPRKNTGSLQRQRYGLPSLGTAGHRLGELHIPDAVFKAGQHDLFLAPNGIHELLFDSPRALLVRWHRDVLELFVTTSSALQRLGRVVQRAFTAKQPDFGAGRQARHGADGEVRLGATGHLTEDIHMVRYAYGTRDAIGIASLVDADLGHGHDFGGWTEPAHERLIPDPHVQRVVATHLSVLPPVQRAGLVDKGWRRRAQFD